MGSIGIIGGSGFIGKNLTAFYSNKGYNVKVVGRNCNGIAIDKLNVEFLQVDIASTDQLLKSVESCEFVIWLASTLVPSTSGISLEDDFVANTAPIIRFLEKINGLSFFKKFIYLSSGGTIYGDTLNNNSLGEDSSKRPISAYGLSKIVTENYIKFLTQNSQIESFILRPSNVYGIYQNLLKPQGIIGFGFKSIIDNTSIDLYGEGKVTRDFIYVADLVKAIDCCIESEFKVSHTSIYNVGSEKGYTIKEILDKISNISKKKIKTISMPARDFDCNYNVLKIDKIKQDLNWIPEVDIDEGLIRVWEWIKKQNDEK